MDIEIDNNPIYLYTLYIVYMHIKLIILYHIILYPIISYQIILYYITLQLIRLHKDLPPVALSRCLTQVQCQWARAR